MSGILFLKTKVLRELVKFYTERVGCEIWLDQGDCVILRHDNFLFGLCERDGVDKDVMLTFFYATSTEVDAIYRDLEEIAVASPKQNEKYNIYQFFARDPEGRTLEFQWFGNRVGEFLDGSGLLRSRRSVRDFSNEAVSEALVENIIDSCRFAPTSYNCQPQYFKIIRDHETIAWLAASNDSATEPIGRAPVAVAICTDTSISKHPVQDGCIVAYHFLLAAWWHGLGTCWMGGMDREDVKARLGIPSGDYLVTVTPLGWPDSTSVEPPARKERAAFIRR